MPKKKQAKKFKHPPDPVRKSSAATLTKLMDELMATDVDSLDKALMAKAMLQLEGLRDGLKGNTDEDLVRFAGAIAKIYEGFMLDALPVSNENIALSLECGEFLKDFLEGGLDDSKAEEDFEELRGRLASIIREEQAVTGKKEEAAEEEGRPETGRETPEAGGAAETGGEPEKKEVFPETYPLPINSEEDSVIYTEFVSETTEHIESIENGIMALEKDPANNDLLNSIFRHFHSVKGAAGFLGILDMNKVSHETENLLDMARKGQLLVDKPIVNLLLKSTDCQVRIMRHLDSRIKNILGKIPKEQIAPPFPIGPLIEEIRGAISGAKGRPVSLLRPVAALAEEEKAGVAPGKAAVAAAIKVSTEKLDILMELVGELVISHTLVVQDPILQNEINANILKNLTYMGKNTKSLQEQVLAVRMIPLRMMFQKMVRLVRDLSDKINKKIHFEISGEETEIDKTVIDQLNDPLVHLLRNSVDHGVETPEERTAKGKPETGNIFLKAFNQGGNVVIEIMDDGKGLNRERIKSKAVEKGLVKADRKLSDKEIFDLILLPGFSTAAKTTDISGRGVGMDVVVRNISKLNGKLEIQSEEEKGSKFTIRLPLTMAIIDGMIVQVGKERYVIPVVSIRESIKPSKKDITSVTKGEEVVNVRGGLVPLIRLNKLFGIPDSKTTPWEALIMIVETNGKQRGIMVDNLVGQQQVVIKNLGARLHGIRGISGGAILGDGKVGLILDVEGIVESL